MSKDRYLKCSCKVCGNHIEFPASSAGAEVPCPHCGKSTLLSVGKATAEKAPGGVPAKSKLPILAALAICAMAAAAVGGFVVWRAQFKTVVEPPAPVKVAAVPTNLPATNVPPPKPAVPEKKQKSLDDLKVGAVQLEKAKVGNLVYAIGTVTNASEFQRFGVKIEVSLYNSNGKKLGATTDYKDIIEPNREWQFRAMVLDSKTTSAKVSAITEE